MLRHVALCAFVVLFASTVDGETLSVAPDSPRWDLQGQAKPADYLGRKSLMLDGGAATLKDFEMRDGVIDVDVATPATRGFFGIQFRIAGDGANAEWVYLRQHKSGLPDALQYTPVLNTGLNWQLYNGTGFTGAVDIPKDVWFHLRLEVVGAQAKLYVGDMAASGHRTRNTGCRSRLAIVRWCRNTCSERGRRLFTSVPAVVPCRW